MTDDKKEEALIQAIESHIAEVVNEEGRSLLDLLTSEIQLDDAAAAEWRHATVSIAATIQSESIGWWEAIEQVAVLGNLTSDELAGEAEIALAGRRPAIPVARASLYALLDSCGRPVPEAIVAADAGLRESHPMLWLDLMIQRMAVPEKAQRLVLHAVSAGIMGPDQLALRLSEMRFLGGRHLAAWLQALRSAWPRRTLQQFDAIIAEAFTELDEVPGPFRNTRRSPGLPPADPDHRQRTQHPHGATFATTQESRSGASEYSTLAQPARYLFQHRRQYTQADRFVNKIRRQPSTYPVVIHANQQ